MIFLNSKEKRALNIFNTRVSLIMLKISLRSKCTSRLLLCLFNEFELRVFHETWQTTFWKSQDWACYVIMFFRIIFLKLGLLWIIAANYFKDQRRPSSRLATAMLCTSLNNLPPNLDQRLVGFKSVNSIQWLVVQQPLRSIKPSPWPSIVLEDFQ